MMTRVESALYSLLAAGPLALSIAAPSPAAPGAAIGEFGLDLTARKPDVKPGDDFFVYAGGAWLDRTEIPADQSWYGAFTRLSDLSDERLRSIIEEAAATPRTEGTQERNIGDLYTSFMGEAQIEALGLTPAAADFARIQKVRTRREVAVLMRLANFESIFAASIDQDLKDSTQYTAGIGQGGLGLPNRDYYLKDDPAL